jgi:tetratricopeptide (TPR) repeat protein
VLARRAADYPRAEALLLRAAEISSGRLKSRALHQLGLVLDAAGRREEAVARLRESISLRPDAERVWVDLGYAEWRRGGIEEARTAFEKAIALDRRFADAQLAMGLFEDARGNRVRAEGFLARAVKLDPEEPAYRKALARHYLAAGDAPRARTALNWLAKQSADQADVAFAQAMLAMLDRDSARMLAEVRRADALRPGGYDDAIEQAAAALHEARRYADARALLDLLLARPQPAPEVLLAAARTASRLGQSQEAEALLLRSLRARPDNSEAWFQLGRVRSERGNVAGAIEAYRASLARNPDARNARLNLAVLYARANREAEALALYGEILAAHPRYAPALLNRARLHERAGRDQLAVTDLEAAMLAAPGDAGIRDRLARLLLRRGETDRARELLAEAIAEQPANPEMRVLMAQTELDAGQRDLALRELNRAAALAGDDRALWAQISEGYRQAGDAAAAAQAGARARASDKPGKER